MPIIEASHFDGSAYEGMIHMNPSKKLKPDDVVAVRAVASQFVSTFRDSGVVCFESHLLPEGGVAWEPFGK
jgi:hypothetical protein